MTHYKKEKKKIIFGFQIWDWLNLRSFLVVGKIQNTKLVEFPVLYFVFCRSRCSGRPKTKSA
jgi:hypothetical protein